MRDERCAGAYFIVLVCWFDGLVVFCFMYLIALYSSKTLLLFIDGQVWSVKTQRKRMYWDDRLYDNVCTFLWPRYNPLHASACPFVDHFRFRVRVVVIPFLESLAASPTRSLESGKNIDTSGTPLPSR